MWIISVVKRIETVARNGDRKEYLTVVITTITPMGNQKQN